MLPFSADPFTVLLEGKFLAQFYVLSTLTGFHYSALESRFPFTVTTMLPSEISFSFLLHRVAIGTLFLQFFLL